MYPEAVACYIGIGWALRDIRTGPLGFLCSTYVRACTWVGAKAVLVMVFLRKKTAGWASKMGPPHPPPVGTKEPCLIRAGCVLGLTVKTGLAVSVIKVAIALHLCFQRSSRLGRVHLVAGEYVCIGWCREAVGGA